MVRTILSILIPFILPFVCFAIWSWYANRKRETLEHGEELQKWQTWPWGRLILTGGVLVIISLGFLFFGNDPIPEGRWVPPTVVDGVVVPGHFEPIEPSNNDW